LLAIRDQLVQQAGRRRRATGARRARHDVGRASSLWRLAAPAPRPARRPGPGAGLDEVGGRQPVARSGWTTWQAAAPQPRRCRRQALPRRGARVAALEEACRLLRAGRGV